MKFWRGFLILIIGMIVGAGSFWVFNSFEPATFSSISTSNLKFSSPKNAGKNGKRIFLNAGRNTDGNTSAMVTLKRFTIN